MTRMTYQALKPCCFSCTRRTALRRNFATPCERQDANIDGVPWIDIAAFHDSMLRCPSSFNGGGTVVYEDTRMKDEYEQWMREDSQYNDY